ncbi:MAG TPA: hypothetical protein VGN83_03365 [Falsiroseomonas sp.]|jgi:hypothetical protein|nr:hypothetical protein [Falsiroseomonas sp.]
MPSDRGPKPNTKQDIASADSFPASDPPSTTNESGTRAVPMSELIGEHHETVPGAVMLARRFPDAEAAKLALEALVRQVPLDRDAAALTDHGTEVELRIAAPPADAARIRALLDRG